MSAISGLIRVMEKAARKAGIKLDYKPVDTGYDQAKTVQAYERAHKARTGLTKAIERKGDGRGDS